MLPRHCGCFDLKGRAICAFNFHGVVVASQGGNRSEVVSDRRSEVSSDRGSEVGPNRTQSLQKSLIKERP